MYMGESFRETAM